MIAEVYAICKTGLLYGLDELIYVKYFIIYI